MRTLALLGAAALVLAGCAGEADPTTTTQTDTTVGSVATTAAPATTVAPDTTEPAEADFTITIAGFSFGPQLTVSVGDVIAVTNEDTFPHTWTSTEGLFDSGTLSGEAVFFHSFDEPGEYQFICSIHPGDMRGSIIVEE